MADLQQAVGLFRVKMTTEGVAWRALNDLREASLKRSPAERISSKDDLGHGHAFDTDE